MARIKNNLLNNIILIMITIYPFLPLIKSRSLHFGNLIDVIFLLCLMISLITIRNRSIVLHLRKPNILYIYMLIIYTILGILNGNKAISGFKTLLFYLLFYHYLLKESKKEINNIVKTIIVIGVIMAVGGIIQIIFPNLISQFHPVEMTGSIRAKTDLIAFSPYNRSISFMSDPNILSVYLVHVFILYENHKTNNNYKVIWLIIFIASILLTQSRTGIVLMFLYSFKTVSRYLKFNSKRNYLEFIFIFLLTLSIIFLITNEWGFIKKILRLETFITGNGRLLNNSQTLSKFLSDDMIYILFGKGLTNGQSYIFENSYYLILGMFGVLGSLVFTFLNYTIFKKVINKKNSYILFIYLCCCLVGDYILIPYVTFVLITILVYNSVNEERIIHENNANNKTSWNGRS